MENQIREQDLRTVLGIALDSRRLDKVRIWVRNNIHMNIDVMK